MAEYRDVPEDDRKKAKVFFDRGKVVAGTGNFDYAIEMYLQGLNVDPEAKDAHQELREISLRRKAGGGKPLGMMEAMKLKRATKDDKVNMLNAEKVLAFDPGNTDHMLLMMECAVKAGYFETALWIGPMLLRAITDQKKPEFKKYIALKDLYKQFGQWKQATEAIQFALRINDGSMDLQSELKNLAAQETMSAGGYTTGGSFRDSMRNKEGQDRLLDESRDYKTEDLITRQIREAEEGYKAEPVEGKLFRLVEFLEKTEDMQNENRALELLDEAYKRTKQFRFRQRMGKIQMAQMKRMERSKREEMQKHEDNPRLKQEYEHFRQEQLQFEMNEFKEWAEAYPTDLQLKFELAARLFALRQYDEAIPLFQQARNDPKLKNDGTIALGRSFLEAGFVDEAIDTLQVIIEEYPLKGDEKSKLMNYWMGRALEQKGQNDLAIKRYSQVAQWEFTYRDVQQRIKQLRSKPPGGTPPA